MSTQDLEAIDTYITNTDVRTPEAGNLQAQWKTWYGNQNVISKALDSTFQEASNRRAVFNAANNQPEDLVNAADLSAEGKVAKQAAIASSAALTPTQKKAALAKNPNIPTTVGVPGSAASHATIRQGSKGADVLAWQNIIGVKGDGTFGAGTTAATKKWQTLHGLLADGIVGPKSWSAALGTTVQEAPSGGISSGTPGPFIPAPATSPPFQPVSPSPAVHEAAVKAGTTPPPSAAVKAAAIVAAPAAHTALKVAIPVVALVTGGWLFGTIGAIVGGALGLFGSSKV